MTLSEQVKQITKNYKNVSVVDFVIDEIKHQARNGNFYLKIDAYFLRSKFLTDFLIKEGFEITYENDLVGIISWEEK
ncbi:MAG TPA: hypothetical protein PLH46_04410 [Caldisericia bacterium]|nr:hypothetical protein [Caldisericia bacterium]